MSAVAGREHALEDPRQLGTDRRRSLVESRVVEESHDDPVDDLRHGPWPPLVEDGRSAVVHGRATTPSLMREGQPVHVHAPVA